MKKMAFCQLKAQIRESRFVPGHNFSGMSKINVQAIEYNFRKNNDFIELEGNLIQKKQVYFFITLC